MKVKHYGELLSNVHGKPLLAYVEFGSYQGDYIAVLDGGANIELFKGFYGSCSGCDWLASRRDWESGELSEEDARSYVETETPFAAIPKDVVQNCSVESFEEMLPANTRKCIYDFDAKELLNEIKTGMAKDDEPGPLT